MNRKLYEGNFYEEDYYDQYLRSKNAATSHDFVFHEWDISFKNITRHLFTGKTARKSMMRVPFFRTFCGNEQAQITDFCKAIFPEKLWEGTLKERNNDATVIFTHNFREPDYAYIEVSDLYKRPNKIRESFKSIGASNVAMPLCTFSGKDHYRSSIYSINGIAVYVDYKNHGFDVKKGKEKVLEILEKEHFGKTMPEPTFIVDEAKLVLIFVFDTPAYVYKHRNGIKFFEWMSSVFAERIAYLGGMPVKANEAIILPESPVCFGRDKTISYVSSWNVYSNQKIDHKNLRSWLPTMEEVKKEQSWYKTQKELKQRELRKDNGWTPTFDKNNELVLKDLVSIRDYYNKSGITWHNKTLLFIYSVYALKVMERQNAITAVLDFSCGFEKKIPTKQILNAITCAETKTYTYKNKTILRVLGISEDMDFELCKNIKKRKEYQNNWKKQKSGKSEKKKSKDKLFCMIKKLREKGLKNTEILKRAIKKGFEISYKSLERYITILIKNGEIAARA